MTPGHRVHAVLLEDVSWLSPYQPNRVFRKLNTYKIVGSKDRKNFLIRSSGNVKITDKKYFSTNVFLFFRSCTLKPQGGQGTDLLGSNIFASAHENILAKTTVGGNNGSRHDHSIHQCQQYTIGYKLVRTSNLTHSPRRSHLHARHH
jgi:hypothetical protein